MTNQIDLFRLKHKLAQKQLMLESFDQNKNSLSNAIDVYTVLHEEGKKVLYKHISEEVLAAYKANPTDMTNYDHAQARCISIAKRWLGYKTTDEEALGIVRCLKFTMQEELKEVLYD